MVAPARLYTPAEAAALSEVGVKTVNNAIDKRIIDPARAPTGGTGRLKPRTLNGEDLLRLKLWSKIGGVLSHDRRQTLFDALRDQPDARKIKADDLLIIDVGEARKQIAARIRILESAEAMVERKKSVMGNEPVFRGTRIPVRVVAAMLAEGASEDEVLEGYPRLDRRQLELARIWAIAHPSRGRPRSAKNDGLTLKLSRRFAVKDDPKVPGKGKAGAAA